VRASSLLHAIAAGATVTALFVTAPARAQVDPMLGHGYVEPCTVANAEEPRTECRACAGSGQAAIACTRELDSEGFRFTCRTGPHSSPVEVWCRKLDAGKPSVRLISGVVVGFVVLLAVAFVWARRQRAAKKHARH
jgi:hypothetical protein